MDTNPSASYLSMTNTPSSKTSSPSQKLLILDLNGTLLYRPKVYPHKNAGRPIHLRPYMSTFCSYLFHESIRVWLDVMVWSSAQPKNVDLMVTKCFVGRHKSNLKAVWARDTLGLDQISYNRKVETIKDLEKPWKSPSLATSFAHSAASTLMMDDSPLKTTLQPYNHLCVPEYALQLWFNDTQVYRQKNTIYDRTLLATIGILEEIKYQTNVAGWLRSGGLWADHGPPEDTSIPLPEIPESELTGADQTSPSESKLLWFNHSPCFEHWVEKGKNAATQLGIPIKSGFTKP